LLLLLAICAAPLIAAWLLASGVGGISPRGLKNHGQWLTPPVSVVDLPLALVAGPVDDTQAPLRGHWGLLVAVDRCDAACLETLHMLRNASLAEGRHVLRIRRVVVVPEGTVVDPALPALRDYPTALILSAPAAAHTALRARLAAAVGGAGAGAAGAGTGAGADVGAAAPARPVYLLDPEGRAILRYDGARDYLGIVADLKQLLTASQGR